MCLKVMVWYEEDREELAQPRDLAVPPGVGVSHEFRRISKNLRNCLFRNKGSTSLFPEPHLAQIIELELQVTLQLEQEAGATRRSTRDKL